VGVRLLCQAVLWRCGTATGQQEPFWLKRDVVAGEKVVSIVRELYNEELGIFNGESLHLDNAAD
jgi:hypothetical protein